MNRMTSLALLAVSLTVGCGTPMPVTDAGADVAPVISTPLFMGGYTATTNIAQPIAGAQACAALIENAEMNQWTMVDTATAATSPFGEMMARVDREFIGELAATSEYGITRTVRRGVMLGLAATTDDERDIAKETVAKPSHVGIALAVDSELRAAIDDAIAARWDSARSHWDRGAAWFTAIEPDIRDYQAQMVIGVWGTNNNALSSDNISAATVDLLRRGRAAIDAMSVRTVVEVGNQSIAYFTRLNFLSGVKYSTNIENAVRASEPVDVAAQPEGTYAFEGAILPFFGHSAPPAVVTARAHWRAAVTTITKTQFLQDAAAVYTAINAASLETYVGSTDNDRWATIARMTGEVDVLVEALTFSGQTPPTLHNQLAMARSASDTGDHAAALALLNQVQTAIGHIGAAR